MGLSARVKFALLIIGLLLGVLGYFPLISLTSGWLIEPESARQVLSDIAKISGTILAVHTTFILFLMRRRPDLLREPFTLSLFAGIYFLFVLEMFLCFFEILWIGRERVDFSTFSYVFTIFLIALFIIAALIAAVFVEIRSKAS